jgi:non-specific serine/threonine protein kinase/serine/threonine-protein kinase
MAMFARLTPQPFDGEAQDPLDQELLRRTDTLVREALRVPASGRESFLRQQTDSDELIRHVLRNVAEMEATVAQPLSDPFAPVVADEPETMDETPAPALDPLATVGIDLDRTAELPTKPSGSRSQRRNTVSIDPDPELAGLPGLPSIGGYKMKRLLAQGGMGAVYEAVQTGEGFERRVAVKVVKPDMSYSTVMQRFLQERRVLAELDHSNIARLYDAGTTDQGAPYLAMEYIEGQRIDEYCEAQGLDVEERIRLCLPLCDAIQYAHQRLIVHRDLKPSNIMVTSEGIPKLLDFGIAKLVDTDEHGVDRLSLTTVDGTPMTPMYASPEQVQGAAVTTSTDLYSLAILIYEVLTGSLPYEFVQFTAAGIERTIVETNPTPPSEAKLERKLAPGETEEKIRKRLRGELDQIFLMALRKEAARRYASVFEFAQDIRNHLSGLPVTAHKDSVSYRMKKFVRRHTGAVAAAVLAVGALASAAVVSTYFASVARQEKVVAERRFQETRELARFFINEFDDAIRSGETAARREMVAKGLGYLKRLSDEAAGDPALEREVISGYLKLGDVQGNPFGPNIGQPAAAADSYRLAMAAAEKYSAGSKSFDKEIAYSQKKLADLDAVGRKPKEALAVYERVLPFFEGLDRADLLNTMGFVSGNLGDNAAALAAYREAEKIVAALLNGDKPSVQARSILARSAERIGETLARTGDLNGAIENLKASLVILEENAAQADGRSPQAMRRIWSAAIILGDVYANAKRPNDAAASYRRSLQIMESLRREDPANRQYRVDLFTTLGRLADVLALIPGQKGEAEKMTESALATLKPVVTQAGASDNEIDQYAWLALTTPFARLRDPQGALQVLEKRVASSASADPRVLDMLAMAYFGVGNKDRAVETEKKALSLLPATPSPIRSELEANLQRFQR